MYTVGKIFMNMPLESWTNNLQDKEQRFTDTTALNSKKQKKKQCPIPTSVSTKSYYIKYLVIS